METKKTIKFLAYIIVNNVLLSRIAVGLEYTHFDNKCRDTTNLVSILALNVKSHEECVKQCWLRQDCLSVIFKRHFSICELYNVDVSELQHEKLGTSCTVIRRDDIHLDGTEVLESHACLYTFPLIK